MLALRMTTGKGLRDAWAKATPTSQPLRFDPHHLHNHALPALAVELRIKNALPLSEIEPPAGDRQRRLMVQQEGLQVRVGVVLAGLVVLVSGPAWGKLLQPYAMSSIRPLSLSFT